MYLPYPSRGMFSLIFSSDGPVGDNILQYFISLEFKKKNQYVYPNSVLLVHIMIGPRKAQYSIIFLDYIFEKIYAHI